MKFKKLLIILAIVLFLFVLVFVKKSAQDRETKKEDTRNELAAGYELIKEIPDIFLSKIVIYKGSDKENKLILSKGKDDTWVVENKFGVKARKETIDGLLGELKDLKGEIRGDSKELFPDFQIEDDKAAHLVLEGSEGKVLKHLVISFLFPEWNKNFVRDAESPKVVLVDRNLLVKLNIFGKDDTLRPSAFADLKLPAFDPQGISGITLESQGKNKIALKKTKSEKDGNVIWSFEPSGKNEEPDPARIEGFLRNISNIYANDVVDPSLKTYGLESPLFRLDLADASGKRVMQIDVGSYIDSEKSYYMKTSSSGDVFKVQDAYIAGLKDGRSSFLKPKEEPAKAAKK